MLTKSIISKSQTFEKKTLYFENVLVIKVLILQPELKKCTQVLSMPLIPLTLDEKSDIGSGEKPSPKQLLFKQTPARLCLCG